ncbi:YibE/F family protein [Gordonia neofelifaecis]|uniref:YibE/F family protein n=1 Tax=Gordonia neofelifaecis NRRL B-59395 TaxID=644548 RepID=F1YFK3_9ACTN|nr:YibE/F family protein [Gordonia neofelifaecis]EGD56387.1 YibE/F family protein [Gordonia neofelifaecis NRRL B-59395]
MSHRLPEPEPQQHPPKPRAERRREAPAPHAVSHQPGEPIGNGHAGHHHGGGDLPGQLTRYAKPVVVGLLTAAALAVGIGMIVLWPGHEDRPIPMQFRSASGGPIQVSDAEVVSQLKTDCSSQASGTATADFPMVPETGGPCRASILKLESGPDQGRYTVLMVATNAAQATDVPGAPPVDPATADETQAGQPTLNKGDEIRVSAMPGPDGQARYAFYDYRRGTAVIVWAVAFVLAIVGVATWRGARAIVGLVIAFAVLGFFTLPSILDGNPVVAVAVVSAAAILFAVLYLAHGFNLRTSSALLGTLASLVLATVLSRLAISTMSLTGLSAESTTNLQLYQGTISLSGLLLAGFVIGTIGVLNDVTITQASATFELAAVPGQTRIGAFRAAMRVGRDHIASTVYTLVFAYAGSALPLLLLFSVAAQPVSSLITGEEVAIELARAFVGGIALAGSVPLTTAIAAALVVPGKPANKATAA